MHIKGLEGACPMPTYACLYTTMLTHAPSYTFRHTSGQSGLLEPIHAYRYPLIPSHGHSCPLMGMQCATYRCTNMNAHECAQAVMSGHKGA